ncbi:hypothetical protein [Cryobacterium psychrophilum]|uniref:Uncharacterized protein n=1 Tax=Cryobacterium psychrophilum TaxID=41988 RepID=A0A4Y8KWK4_9MICO|nr:hypothetical protein [Cryobacterium psychrophilum]TFD82365.1 hypothetical protein E3T53_00345 [Cryobacterium psychrophilum]
MQEKALPFHTEEETAAMDSHVLANLPTSEHPYLAELTADHVLQPDYDYDYDYEVTFDLDLDRDRDRDLKGLERIRGNATDE